MAASGIGTLTSTLSVSASWQASATTTFAAQATIANNNTITKKLSQGTSAGDASAGGADSLGCFISSISASSSNSIDLTAMTDVLATAGVTLARMKGIILQLLSATDDATIGTAAASITIDNTVANAISAASHSGWFDNGNEGAVGGSKFSIANGDYMSWGSSSAGGVVISSTSKIIKLTNNDGALTAKAQLTIIGSDA